MVGPVNSRYLESLGTLTQAASAAPREHLVAGQGQLHTIHATPWPTKGKDATSSGRRMRQRLWRPRVRTGCRLKIDSSLQSM